MNEYPALWTLYPMVLVLPFVLLAACFVRPKVGRGKEKGREGGREGGGRKWGREGAALVGGSVK